MGVEEFIPESQAGFTYTQPASRVIFGTGTLSQHLPAELHRLSVKSPLLICNPRHAETVTAILSGIEVPIQPAGTFAGAKIHTPIEVTEKAIEYVHDVKPDSIVSIGGGSAIGLGKAIAYRSGMPHIAVPTTYSGSEMTASLGETQNGRKVGKTDEKIRATCVIYDVELTMSLPMEMTKTSGVNAIAHAYESLWAANRNPVVRLMAVEGIMSLQRALQRLVHSPDSKEYRHLALYGAYLCGSCSASGVKMGIHHKIAHVLGGSFGLPHSETHTVLLPVTVNYNKCFIARGDGSKLQDTFVGALLKDLELELSLEKLGLKKEDIPKAVEIVMEGLNTMQSEGNYMMADGGWHGGKPRLYTEEDVRKILEEAWAGKLDFW